jgi:hypothetical protein
MMIEGTVFLHKDDDVLDILNRACAVVRWNRERLGDVRLQRAHRRGRAHDL